MKLPDTLRFANRPDQLSSGQRQRVASARATGEDVIHLLEMLNAGGSPSSW